MLAREVAGCVAGFDLATTVEELPPDAAVPAAWRELLRVQSATGAPSWPRAWNALRGTVPAIDGYLRGSLRGVAVLLEAGREPSLLYVATLDSGSTINCYRGWPPVGVPAPGSRLAAVWASLPQQLRHFYAEVHDGWTELASGAGGLVRSGDLGLLSDPEWDLDVDALRALPCPPEAVLLVFGNAAGDYLGLDTLHPTLDGRGQGG